MVELPPAAVLDQAVASLRRGGVVAFPTETAYGLAVDPTSPAAVTRLFALKRRPADKPLLLLIESEAQLAEVATAVPSLYRPLMARFWPGPLTLVFPARAVLDRRVTGGSGTVGVRISPHPLARELVRRFGGPITATSANVSGQPPATSAALVLAQFGEHLDAILDGGPSSEGPCSTVCGMVGGTLTLLRPGRVDFAACLAAVQPGG